MRELEELRDQGSAPARSPDGSRIAVITDPGLWEICDGWTGCRPGRGMGQNPVIYTYDFASAERELIDAMYSAPAVRAANPDWSPDGSQLVFDLFDPTTVYGSGRYFPQRRIFTLSVETGEVRQLVPEAANPAVTVYSDHGAVWSRVTR